MKKKSESFQIEITEIYLLVMLVIFPLFVPRGYDYLFQNKWNLFLYATIFFLAIVICMKLFTVFIAKERGKGWNLSGIDWCVLLYSLFVIVSFLRSDYKTDALLGVVTWNMGLVTQVLLVCMYFAISRIYVKNIWIEAAAGVSWLLVCSMLILQRFGLDLFHLYKGYPDEVRIDFVTTTGQVTWGSVYLTMGLCFCLGTYLGEERKKKKAVLSGFLMVGFAAAIIQNCDSAVLGIVGVMAVLFWKALKQEKLMIRFLEVMICALFGMIVIGIFERIFAVSMVPIDTVYLKIAQSVWLYPMLLAAIGMRSLVLRQRLRITGTGISFLILRGIYLMAVIGGTAAVILLFVYHTKGFLPHSAWNNYFYFSDWWGNSRGFIWKAGAAVFEDFSVGDKLFGCGPDSFTGYVYDLMGNEMREFWSNQLVPNVHNEWFNGIINYGILGGGAYLGIFLLSAGKFLSGWDKNIDCAPMGLAVTAYILHNVLCYQQIVGAPIVVIIIAIGAGNLRRNAEIISERKSHHQ